jgi:hypothetical protein
MTESNCRFGYALIFFLAICSIASAQSQLQIEADDWGFDGRVVPSKFNLLTLIVRNVSDKKFDGVISLRREAGGLPVDAALVEPVSISAGSKRLVQFYPYIGESVDEFEATWGRGVQDQHSVEPPSMSAGARVMLNDPRIASGFQVSLRTFREDHFPASVVGTDCLRAVVLDHLPRWQAAQREAFRDWLFKGGQLHLIHGPNGKFPESPIPELNQGQPTSFGNGQVFWHPMGRRGVNRQFTKEVVFKHSRPVINLVSIGNSPVDTDPTLPGAIRSDSISSDWHAADDISRKMKDLISFKHSWGLIFLFSFAYVLIVFPGGWLLAIKVTDYRVNLAALLVVVTLTSFLFSSIGARGFGEEASTHTLARATPLPDGYWSTDQLHSVFVTNGARYTLQQNSEVAVFSAAQNRDAVKGFIDSGRNARFNVDIPPFTFRSFATRSKVKMAPVKFSVTAVKTQGDSWLANLVLKQDGELPSRPLRACVVYKHVFYSVDTTALSSGTNILRERELALDYWPMVDRTSHRSSNEAATYLDLQRWLIAQELGFQKEDDTTNYQYAEGRICLLIYAELPTELHIMNASGESPEPMGKQQGRILYRFDLSIDDAQ